MSLNIKKERDKNSFRSFQKENWNEQGQFYNNEDGYEQPTEKLATKYKMTMSRSSNRLETSENTFHPVAIDENSSNFLKSQRTSRNLSKNSDFPNLSKQNRQDSETRRRFTNKYNDDYSSDPYLSKSKDYYNEKVPIKIPKRKQTNLLGKFLYNLIKFLTFGFIMVTLIWSLYKSFFNSKSPPLISDFNLQNNNPVSLIFPKQKIPEKQTKIIVKSSKSKVFVEVNGAKVYIDQHQNTGRGLHVVILSSKTAQIVAKYIFDTYTPTMENNLLSFLYSLNPDRIVVMMIKDEASTHLKSKTRKVITEIFGSRQIGALTFRSMWTMIATTGNSTSKTGPTLICEKISMSNKKEWAAEIKMEKFIQLIDDTIWCPNWGEDNGDDRFINLRRKFCQKYGGYNSLCKCEKPDSLRFYPEDFRNNLIVDTDVIIMTCDRPRSLYRSLRSILQAYGVNRERIWIMVDGYDYADETKALSQLFGVNWKVFAPRGVQKARITQHYFSVLRWVFDDSRDTEQVIILEDDLEVSRDFFSYFSQTIGILKEDNSLWCISAWNDYGFKHTSVSDSKVYRVEGMPGLGWMLTKRLFKGELEDQWPEISDKRAWDEWLRQDQNLGKKECIIPDIPRTFHFSSKNKALPAHFQDDYYNRKAFMESTDGYPVNLDNVENLLSDKYENLMYSLVSESLLVDHNISPCSADFMKNADSSKSYIAYFRMSHEKSTEVFINIAKCLKIWDIDTRSIHKGAIRMFVNKAHIIFVGYPSSPYSVHKPHNVVAYYF